MSSPVPASTTQLNGMRGGRIAPDEAVSIAVNVQPLMGVDRSAFRVVDPRVELERRRLARFGDLDRAVGGDIPGVRQIQIRRRARHQRGIRQARAGILGRKPGNAAGLGHGRPNRIQREISRAGRPLALSEIHRDAHAPVALVLQSFDLAESHADRKTSILADGGFRLRGAARARFFESTLNDRFKVFLGKA